MLAGLGGQKGAASPSGMKLAGERVVLGGEGCGETQRARITCVRQDADARREYFGSAGKGAGFCWPRWG